MEILKHGNNYYYQECQYCHAYLSYTSSDIKTHMSDIDDPYFSITFNDYIICPECQHKLTPTKKGVYDENNSNS